ncbi:AAA family ATPase [Streptomyces sp. NPDC058326]|uniref:AAA family ATPase n=1 Tax=Streptomyces sp. NPDC058326 TaxID=3346447 RepID=UPI0036E391D7
MGATNVRAAGQGDGVRLTDRPRGHPGLVGRDAELAALRAALATHRLVTVTGAAGVGKSRLALAAVACPQDSPWQAMVRVRWHDGVPAGPWALAARIARALDAATGENGRSGTPDLAAAVRSLPDGELLLLLDDMDPVHADCTRLAQSLLTSLPTLRILITARRPLGLGHEHVLRLAPLATDTSPDGLSPAAELFHALTARRAPATAAGREAADAEALDREAADRAALDRSAVDRVCALVEGVPLALELAAAQLEGTTMSRLVARLESGQCWLTGPGPGAAIRRHRSVRASMGAVHSLCEPAVRKVWRRLSVFADTFTEQAAAFVCEGTDLAAADVPAALAELTAIGVLVRRGEPGEVREPRYRMARAARDFGAERLEAAGEPPAARARHARHCRSVAAVAETLWNTGLQQQAVQLVHDAYDDLTDLVRRAARPRDHAEIALETLLHLWFWWATRNRGEEGARHLLTLLPLLPAGSPLTARGQWLAAWLAAGQDPATAHRLLDRAWPAAVLAGDDALVGRIAHAHGTLAWRRHDLATAAEHYRQAAGTIPEDAPGGPGPMVSLAALAVVRTHTAPALAARTARRALAQRAGGHDSWAAALAHYALAVADHRAGHTGRARHRARRALGYLDARLDAPQARTALRSLLDLVDPRTAPSPRPRVRLPAPRTEPRPPSEHRRQEGRPAG